MIITCSINLTVAKLSTDIDLGKYVKYNDNASWKALGCDDSFSVVCLDPPVFFALYSKDQNKFLEIKDKLTEKFGNDQDKLKDQLQKEFDDLKKEILKDDQTLDKLREAAYSQLSLIKALQVNRILELDQIIANKKSENK